MLTLSRYYFSTDSLPHSTQTTKQLFAAEKAVLTSLHIFSIFTYPKVGYIAFNLIQRLCLKPAWIIALENKPAYKYSLNQLLALSV